MSEKDKIVLYEDKQGNVELRADAEKDTLWATQAQIGDLFEVDVRTVNEHLRNIFRSEELVENSVIRKSRITAKDGKKYLTLLYNLDAIIAVGYRVNSKKATKFRIWATSIIKRFVLAGYSLNTEKLMKSSRDLESLNDAIAVIQSPELKGKIKAKIKVNITKDLI